MSIRPNFLAAMVFILALGFSACSLSSESKKSEKQKNASGDASAPGAKDQQKDTTTDQPSTAQCTACVPGCDHFCKTKPEELRAFPGAEGFGAYTKGGRGGKVMFVDNLKDSGEGSFRACAEASGPRLCLVRVDGTIELQDKIDIDSPNITIAGQTAPGDGITLKSSPSYTDPTLKITASDVIIRGIRIRSGASTQQSTMRRGINIEDAASNIIIDRSSISWATDDNITMISGIRDVTVQYSIISEGLSNSTHSEGEHSKAFAISGKKYNGVTAETGNISVHHNLFAHNSDRNVRHAAFGVVDFVNNVIYNWGISATEANDGQAEVPLNAIGNYYKAGNSTTTSPEDGVVFADTDEGNGALVYYKDNFAKSIKSSSQIWEISNVESIQSPHPTKPITTTSADQAYADVLAKAGAWPRDAVDLRVVADTKNGTGKIIDDPKDTVGANENPWPELKKGTLPKDSDNDGIPDDWETKFGMDPNKNDSSEDIDSDGYTNIEEYINSLF